MPESSGSSRARLGRRLRGRLARGPGSVRTREHRLLRDSGLIDRQWIQAQVGRELRTIDDAVDAYLDDPAVSPHPLFDTQWIEPQFGTPTAGRSPLAWFLSTPRVRRRARTSCWFDTGLAKGDPELRRFPHGPLAGWLQRYGDDEPLPGSAGSQPMTVSRLRDLGVQALLSWTHDRELRRRPGANVLPTLIDPAGVPEPREATLVSVVMPLWNRAASVRRAVASVQAQSHHAWELLIVDDGSTDDGAAVAEGIAAYDRRIRVIRQPHAGASAARNRALQAATGTWVAFLEGDKPWQPDFLRVMVHELESRGLEMAHAAMRVTRDGRPHVQAFEGSRETLLVADHVDLDVLVARSSLVREVGGFDETLRRGAAWDLVLRLTRRARLHLVPYLGVDHHQAAQSEIDPGPPDPISGTESAAWLSVVASRHLVDWAALGHRDRVAARTSVVLLSERSAPRVEHTLRWIDALAGHPDLEVVVVGSRLSRAAHVALHTAAGVAGATLVTLPADHAAATLLNVGYARTTGDRVAWVAPGVEPDVSSLLRLTESLDGCALVQPAVVTERGLLSCAGAVFAPGPVRPEPFLGEHPLEDARRAGRVHVPGALGPVVAVRGELPARHQGLDPLVGDQFAVTDLSLRIQAAGDGAVLLEPSCVMVFSGAIVPEDDAAAAAAAALDLRRPPVPAGSTAAWAAAGLEVVGHGHLRTAVGDSAPKATLLRPRTVLRPIRSQVSEAPPRLRWTIDVAAPGGPRGQLWGDTHFGTSLAQALRRLGQDVAVDSRPVRDRSTRDLDDVVLVLRGLDGVEPLPGRVNVEWIISHPDLVTKDEVAGFDLVYAASQSWPVEVEAAWGVPVRPLLQATDPELFNPDRAEFDSGAGVLFVGNSRGVFRTSLRYALAAATDVEIHGSGWTPFLGTAAVASPHVDNQDLGAMYAAAGLVLNDHWEDMRLKGFLSNRLMDAAACGARVATDHVPGVDLAGMFGGLVLPYEDEDDFRRILAEHPDNFPRGDERRRAAAAVAAEHSFDARAATILADVVPLVLRAQRL